MMRYSVIKYLDDLDLVWLVVDSIEKNVIYSYSDRQIYSYSDRHEAAIRMCTRLNRIDQDKECGR